MISINKIFYLPSFPEPFQAVVLINNTGTDHPAPTLATQVSSTECNVLELHGPRVVFGGGRRAGAGFAVLGGTRAVGCWTLLEVRKRQLNGGTPEDVATTCLSVGDLVGFEMLSVPGHEPKVRRGMPVVKVSSSVDVDSTCTKLQYQRHTNV